MRKSDEMLKQESLAKTDPNVGLSEKDLDQVTGGGGKANAETKPTETVSLDYSKIEWTYTPQR
jgi:type VI protein secretion system component Hcp